MKKQLVIALLLVLANTIVLAAEQNGYKQSVAGQKGGYTGPSEVRITTVLQAKQMRDDTKVTLRGHIVRQVTHEKYLFKDSTGEIIVEIDDSDWKGLTIDANDLIEIKGEVDKDWNSVEIEVEIINRVNE